MPDTSPDARMPLGLLATRVMRALETELFARLRESGFPDLRPRHSALLTALEPQGTRLTVLATRAAMTPQAMGELVDDLEQKGYLHRMSDPTDRRARLVAFTPRGQQALSECLAVVARVEAHYASLLGQDRYDTARTTLAELLGHLESTGQ